MYPVGGSGSPVGTPRPRRKRIIVRRARRLEGLARRNASNRQVTSMAGRLSRSVNRAQTAGSYGPKKRAAVRRTIRSLSRDNSLYSRRAAGSLRRAVRQRGTKIGSGIGTGIHAGQPPPKKGTHHVNKPQHHKPPKQQAPTHNRPPPNLGPPGRPKGHHGPSKPHHGPGNGHPGHHNGPGHPSKPHHGKGPGKGKGPKNIKLGKPGKKLARRITNVTEKRFLYASPKKVEQQVVKYRKRRKYIVKHSKGKREKTLLKIARKNLMKDVRTRGTGAKPIYRKAGLAVSAELDPQLKALTSRIKQTRRDKRRTAQDLKGIYKTALEQHRGYQDTMRTGAQEDIQTTRDQFDNLVDKIAGGYNTSRQSVVDELDRLGIGAATNASTSALDRDKQYATSLARTSGAESTAEQRTNLEGAEQLMSLLGGEMSAQGLAARTEARQKFTDALMKYRDQRSALAATRLGKISTAAEALRAARQQAQSEALQNALAAKLANRNFKLDVAKFKSDAKTDRLRLKLDAKNQRFDNLMDLKKYNLDKLKFMSDQLGNGGSKKNPRSYSNSRGGAVDFLRDRKVGSGAVDGYLNVLSMAHNISKAKGWANLPRGQTNEMVQFVVRQLSSRGVPPKLAMMYGKAMKIEWGLI